MVRRALKLLAVPTIAIILGGCAGGGLLALLGLIAVGNVVTEVTDLIGGNAPDELDVYLDGQLLPVHPDSSGDLHLQGLPEGGHLLQIIAPNRLDGAVSLVTVDPDASLQLGDLDSQRGGRIRGRLTVQDAGGPARAAVRSPVYAIPGGAALVATGASRVEVPPNGTHFVAFTDGNGNFSLDAVAPGYYLVTAAVAGYDADARLVEGLSAGQVVSGQDLALAADGIATGSASGVVAGEVGGGTQSLPGAAVRGDVPTAFAPDVPQAVIDRIATQAGAGLRSSPWFRWQILSTLADAGGSWSLALPTGTSRISAFAYDYRPGFLDVAVTAGANSRTDFALQRR